MLRIRATRAPLPPAPQPSKVLVAVCWPSMGYGTVHDPELLQQLRAESFGASAQARVGA